MKLNIASLSLTSDGEPPNARRITGNLGCNLWIDGVVINADAATFRQLARAADEAAAIEEECDALKAQPHPFQPWFTTSMIGCRMCGKDCKDPIHLAPMTVHADGA